MTTAITQLYASLHESEDRHLETYSHQQLIDLLEASFKKVDDVQQQLKNATYARQHLINLLTQKPF